MLLSGCRYEGKAVSSDCSLSKLQQAVNRVSMGQHTCRLASAALRSVMLHIGLSLQTYTRHDHNTHGKYSFSHTLNIYFL